MPHVGLLWKAGITCDAFKSLLSFMNRCHIFVQVALGCKNWITTNTFIRFPFFMNWKNVAFQVWFRSKTSLTNIAFERLFSFMNWIYMLFFSEKLVSQVMHLKAFVSTWIFATCLMFIQVAFVCKSWITKIAVVRFPFSWIDKMCFFKLGFEVKLASQTLHLKDFFPSWMMFVQITFTVPNESYHFSAVLLHKCLF